MYGVKHVTGGYIPRERRKTACGSSLEMQEAPKCPPARWHRASDTVGLGEPPPTKHCLQPARGAIRAGCSRRLVQMKARCIKRNERGKEPSYKKKRRNHKLKQRDKKLCWIFFFFLCKAIVGKALSITLFLHLMTQKKVFSANNSSKQSPESMNNNTKFLEISQAHRISRLLLLLGGCVSKTVDEAIWGGGGVKGEKGRKNSPFFLHYHLPGI